MKLENISKTIEEVERAEKDKIINILRGVDTSNPTIKKLSKNSFVMKASELSAKSWSPTYYDYDKQIEMLVRGVESRPLLQGVLFLKKTLDEGRVTEGLNRELLNENLISRIQAAIEAA